MLLALVAVLCVRFVGVLRRLYFIIIITFKKMLACICSARLSMCLSDVCICAQF